MTRQVPNKVKAVIFSDIIINVVSLVRIFTNESGLEFRQSIISFMLVIVIGGLLIWGMSRGNKIALGVKGLFLLIQLLSFPVGSIIAVVQTLLLLSKESRNFFGIKERTVINNGKK